MFSSFFGKGKNDAKTDETTVKTRGVGNENEKGRNNKNYEIHEKYKNSNNNKEYYDNLKNILALHDESSKISKREAKVTSGENNEYDTAADSVEKKINKNKTLSEVGGDVKKKKRSRSTSRGRSSSTKLVSRKKITSNYNTGSRKKVSVQQQKNKTTNSRSRNKKSISKKKKNNNRSRSRSRSKSKTRKRK